MPPPDSRARSRARDAKRGFASTWSRPTATRAPLTGLRVTTVAGATIIDAAHIHQFARSQNNTPQNGIALCKNAHWLFDCGLWSLDDDYRVIVADEQFEEQAPDQKPLAEYAGRRLRLPKDERLWPEARHLAWHREKRLAGGRGSGE